MARRALLFEDGVRRGHAATAVHTRIFVERVPGNPDYRQDRYEKAQPELGAFQRSRSLEIVEIDALGEFFGGARSSHVVVPTACRSAPIADALFQKSSTQYFSAITACTAPNTIRASEMGMCTSSQR